MLTNRIMNDNFSSSTNIPTLKEIQNQKSQIEQIDQEPIGWLKIAYWTEILTVRLIFFLDSQNILQNIKRMGLLDNSVFQFFYGIAGVYLFSFASSVLHEKLLKRPYLSLSTGNLQLFNYPIVLTMFPYLIGWQGGKTLARATGDIVWLPTKTVIYCAIAVLVGTLSYNDAILEASYPLVIMFKSCSILSVILVGVFFSQVKDGTLKLGVNKLVVGALVSTGICLFNYFSMEDKGEKSTTLLGFCLLVVSLVADGLLPDFQAQMKSVYKPRPVDLMFQINKWTFLLSFFYSLVTMEFWSILSFIRDHPTVLTDICGIAFLNFFVQMFVYYLIQKFKQHVAPFAITIRRIFSVVISIFWFDHQINLWQWMGVGVVFMAAVCDFILERRAKNDEIAKQEEQPDLAKVEVKIETEEVGEYCRIYDDSIADQVKIIGAQHTQEPGCLKIVK